MVQKETKLLMFEVIAFGILVAEVPCRSSRVWKMCHISGPQRPIK